MPDDLRHGIRDFSKYDTMDTAALEELLRADCDAPEDAEQDTELLLYVMEVLAKRRAALDPDAQTVDEAWESFKQNYCPDKAMFSARRGNSRQLRAPWTRGIVAAAAALVLVVCIPITARALNWGELWDVIATWAKETFCFVSGEDTQVTEPDRHSTEDFASLQEALAKSNRDPDILPTWMPEGFELDKIEKDITPVREIYYAIYSNGDKTISIRIHNHISNVIQAVEISGDLIEEFTNAGITYYIFTNNQNINVLWVKDTYECLISGDLSIEEVKQMIKSIGKE